jgi:2-oxoglutarate dehydrogenase E2 component (dihydrolipoamide succinyltransferase)
LDWKKVEPKFAPLGKNIMPIELKVPAVGESISEVEIGEWRKSKGDAVKKDETIVVLESEKATVELPAPASGVLGEIFKKKGETARIGEVIASIDDAGKAAPEAAAKAPEKSEPAASPESGPRVMPAAQAALAKNDLKAEEVKATGPGGRLLKEDVLRQVEERRKPEEAAPEPTPVPPAPMEATPDAGAAAPKSAGLREEETVPMSRLRKTLAERLVQAQHNAALLTTFNEIDMSVVIGLRKEYGEIFQTKHGVKLGFMSFFVKAAIDALKNIPQINAEIRGTDVVYHNYYDIGVAIGSGRGLVVPVLRNAERMGFAEIEVTIAEFARRAKDNKLKLDELQGGTFTISNGGVYGSLLSTPIVNPPQSGILGLHAIQDRPMAVNGQVVIRPMMYVALTYDHRIVDGREAVTFLRRIKETIETPARILLEA